MDFGQKRDRILAIDAEQSGLAEEKKRISAELQAECAHETVAEAHLTGGHSRICCVCGLEEERGCTGYKTLLRAHRTVFQDEFLRLRKLQPLVVVSVPQSMAVGAC